MAPVPVIPATVSQLLDLYEADILPHQAPNTQKRKRNLYQRLRREFGEVLLDELTPERLRHWGRSWGASLRPGSMATYMQSLSAVLTMAVKDYDLLPENPMLKVRRPRPGRGRVRFLSPEERQALLSACQRSRDPKLYYLVQLALGTGARKNELLTLRWPQIDFAQGLLRLEKTKTDLPRSIPLSLHTLQLMQAWSTQAPGLWVFPGPRGVIPADIARQWGHALRRARIEGFTFHGLRHTFASYLAMQDVPLVVIKELLGHRSIKSTEIYVHLMPGHAKPYVERMAQSMLVDAPA